MVERYTFDIQVNKYYSEIYQHPQVKKFYENLKKKTGKEPTFLIRSGGKNAGKSYDSIQKILPLIKSGKKIVWMRNSKEEIKQFKYSLEEIINNNTQFTKTVTSDEGIYTKAENGTMHTIVTFVSSKNYNKLSGNIEPYDAVVYDEFNQHLTSDMSILVSNFFLTMSTAFRNKPWRIIANGNNKSKNNVLYNLLNINIEPPTHNFEIIVINDTIVIEQYLNTLFKEANMDEGDADLIKNLNPLLYNEMFVGNSFEKEDELVVNGAAEIIAKDGFKPLKKLFIINNRFYQIFQLKKLWLVQILDERVNLDQINKFGSDGYEIYEINQQYFKLNRFIRYLPDTPFGKSCESKLKNEEILFCDYPSFLEFIDNTLVSLNLSFI